MIRRILISFLFFASFCLHNRLEEANAEEFQGKFADWSVFVTDSGLKNDQQKICYMVSLPIKRDGNYNKRGQPYFMITNSDDNIDEITISSGYNYKNGSEVELSFGLRKFNIFTYQNRAWANNKTDDIEITKEMRRSFDLVVLGVMTNNKYSADTYSMIGFTKAYNSMKALCASDDKME